MQEQLAGQANHGTRTLAAHIAPNDAGRAGDGTPLGGPDPSVADQLRGSGMHTTSRTCKAARPSSSRIARSTKLIRSLTGTLRQGRHTASFSARGTSSLSSDTPECMSGRSRSCRHLARSAGRDARPTRLRAHRFRLRRHTRSGCKAMRSRYCRSSGLADCLTASRCYDPRQPRMPNSIEPLLDDAGSDDSDSAARRARRRRRCRNAVLARGLRFACKPDDLRSEPLPDDRRAGVLEVKAVRS